MGLIHFCYNYNYDYDYDLTITMTMTITNYDYNFGCWLLAIGYQPLVTHLTSYILHLFLNCKITKHLHTFCDM